METGEAFVWRGHISTYQCDLIPIKSNTPASNLYGINLRSLLLNGCISLITMFKSHDLLPIESNILASNLDGINSILIFELMEFPYFRVHATISSPCIYTPIIQISCAVMYICCEYRY